MRFGLICELSVPRPWTPGKESSVFHSALEQVRVAESVGFDQVWCVEHHFLEEYSHSSCPDMFLTACATQTQRMRLGFGIATCVPEITHPVRIAEKAAFLDCLSGGRVDVGTGRSSTWNELGGFRARVDDTKKTWDEYVRTLPKMWTQERFRHRGYSFSMPERAVLPKPVQKPHPPLWVAVTSPGTEIDAAERGLGCLCLSYGGYDSNARRFDAYRRIIRSCVPVSDTINEQIAAVNWLHCHEDGALALKRGNDLVSAFSSAAAQTIEIKQAYPASNYLELGQLGQLRADPLAPWDSKKMPDGLCIGDPEEITNTLRKWEAAGVDSMVFLIQYMEYLPQEEILRSLRLFGKEVLPKFSSCPDSKPRLKESLA
jgi:alkanesulfonate monooxygenase SsuD/methylene tetrahydromethanopterin reductase-like flavin-dependent oxidoreductase (luciferase family)